MRNILSCALLFLYLFTACSFTQRFNPSANPPSLLPCRVPEQIRVALVLGCGGVRGIAHIAVIEELEKAGVPIDLIVGCSAGSLIGSLYADNPNCQRVKNAVWRLKKTTLLDVNIFDARYGLSQGGGMYRVLDKYLRSSCFEDLQIPFVAVATDLCTGELVPLGSGDLITAVKASCSIPLVYVPVECAGRILVDGGVVDPVPVRVARDLGAQHVIAVDLCELLSERMPTNLFGVASRSANIALQWQSESSVRGADIVIRPSLCGIGMFDDTKNGKIYEAGRVAAKKAMPRIQELLSKISPVGKRNLHTICVELPPYSPE